MREDIPNPIFIEAKRHLNGDGDIRIACCSDLESDGDIGEAWLLATDKSLIVLERNGGKPHVLHSIRLDNLKDFSCSGQVGNGFLQATVNGKPVRLLRYSNTHARKFGVVVRLLDSLVKGEELKLDGDGFGSRCPKCHFPLESRSSVCVNCVKKRKAMLRLLEFMRPHKRSALLVFLLMLFSVALSLLPPYLCKLLMDNVLPGNDKQLLNLVILGLIGASVLSAFFSIVYGRIGSWLGATIIHTIRMLLCEHVEKLSISFFDKRRTNDVMGRVNYDTLELQGFMTFDIYFFCTQIVQLIGGLVIMLSLNWKLALVALVPAPFTILFAIIMTRKLRYAQDRFWHWRGRFGTILNDCLCGLKITKAFAREDAEVEKLRQSSLGFMTASAQADAKWNTLVPPFVLVATSGTFLVWWLGGLQVVTSGMSLGDLMATLGYIGLISGPVQVVVRMGDRLTRVLSAAERVFEMLDTPVEQPDSKKAVSMPELRGQVEFRDLTFSFEPHNPVLQNINLEVKPGEMIGLVGHSGAGKSTMVNLICSFYTAQEGELLIDGVNIKDANLDDLRKHIGIVPQDPYLFSGTIGENIAYGKSYAPMEEIIKAAKTANAHDFIIRLPDGYETWVGQGGQNLSGGERQRIAIARAILRDPRILILDEATSSVDTFTEHEIQEALAKLVENRTTFAIAHRLSTLKRASRLVVLDHGRLVELGTHDELMRAKGTYYNLVEMQTRLSQIKMVGG